MLNIKNLFARSLLAGLHLGIGVICCGYIESAVIQGLTISIIFLGMMELDYPLITERWGNAKLMTTFMGYVSPDATKFRLIIRKIIPGNIIGILISLLLLLVLPDMPNYIIENSSWWKILLSSLAVGFLLDNASKSYRLDSKSKWLMFSAGVCIGTIGLNHFLVDIIRVASNFIEGNIDLLSGFKIIGISLFGNFLGSRIRTLIVEDNEKNR